MALKFSHLALQCAIMLALFATAASAHTVTMNLRFHITNLTDTTHSGTDYISSEHGNIVAALAFAGSQLLNMAINKQSDPYLFRLTQDENQNRVIFALTAGTWQSIERMPAGNVPATTIGNLSVPASFTPGLALQQQYDVLDLTGMLGPGQLLVKSLGGLNPIIGLQVVG